MVSVEMGEASLFRMSLKDSREGLSGKGISLVRTHPVLIILCPALHAQLHTYSCKALERSFVPSFCCL